MFPAEFTENAKFLLHSFLHRYFEFAETGVKDASPRIQNSVKSISPFSANSAGNKKAKAPDCR
jgi:hypothetical protein